MNVDVKIYIANVKKFFDSNEEDLKNLVPLDKKGEFYKEIELVAEENYKNGNEIELTKTQYIDICLKLNGVPEKSKTLKKERREQIQFIENAFGKIFLN